MMTPGFSSPPNVAQFQAQVWSLVKLVPPGKVATYGQIASLIPPPHGMDPKAYAVFAPRWVGSAMARCPEGIPWQRIVNSQGKTSLSSTGGGNHQRELLEAEGVLFDEHDRIDLKKYRWAGPENDNQSAA